MNIGALQSMMGMNLMPTNNLQKSDPATSNFGAIFAGISSNSIEMENPIEGSMPTGLIPDLFNASTFEELEIALQAMHGSENVELPSILEVEKGTVEELANVLDVNPEEILVNLQQLLEQSGISKDKTEELTVTTDMWTVLNLIDEAGVQFFDNLSEHLVNPGATTEATQLLSLLKAIELIAPKKDLTISMEQVVDSFRQTMNIAAGQFEQRIIAVGKQEQLPFVNQKNNFRIVLETNSATSANAEGSGQKNTATTNASTMHAASTSSIVREEIQPNQIAESKTIINSHHVTTSNHMSSSIPTNFGNTTNSGSPTNRSDTFLNEMQALMKRASFGQVGGTNRMLIKLYPEHLGQIRIELLETNGVMTARILASTAFAKGMLDSQLHQLKHAFNQQNLQVDRIDISQTIQESQRNEREQSFNEQFKREQQTDDNKKKQSSEEEISFEEYMVELEV